MIKFARVLGMGGSLLCFACNGFPDAAPIAEAELKPETYPTYEAVTAAPLISTEGQRWVILQGSAELVPAAALQPIASGTGGELSASKFDQAPYDQLYARDADGRHKIAAEVR